MQAKGIMSEEKINELKSTYTNEYQSYIEKKSRLNKLLSLSSENARKLDFYKFEIGEIKAAKLIPGEDTELEERLDMLKNSEKITAMPMILSMANAVHTAL